MAAGKISYEIFSFLSINNANIARLQRLTGARA